MDSHKNEIKETPQINCRKWYRLAGAFFIFLPVNFPIIWGNVEVYITSYYYSEYGSTSSSSTWILSMYFIGLCTALNITGYLTCCGRKLKMFLATLIFCTPFVIISFALKYGITPILYCSVLLIGFCTGVFDPVVFEILTEVSDSSGGKFISIASSGRTFGAVLINVFMTSYVNPENLVPNLIVDNKRLFSQKDVYKNIPSAFLILAFSCLACMAIGMLLILHSIGGKDTSNTSKTISYESLSKQDEVNTGRGSQETTEKSPNTMEDAPKRESSIETPIVATPTAVVKYDSARDCEPVHTTMNSCNDSVGNNKSDNTAIHIANNSISITNSNSDSDCSSHRSNTHYKEFTPRQTLRYFPFYILFFAYGSSVFPAFLQSVSYKSFGLIWIKDDHLLAKLGSALALSASIFRIFWGFPLEKLTIKTCLVCIYSFMGIITVFLYFTPNVNTYIYFFVSIMMSCGNSTFFPTFTTVTIVYFGKEHFYQHLGMLNVSRLIGSLLVSPLFESLSEQFGWFSLFACSASILILTLILVALFVPDVKTKRSEEP